MINSFMQNLISPLFLRTFRKSYELKNFTKAAQELGMTQSGVSQHVASIEETLGTPLFERIGRGLFPTSTADKLYAFGGQWISQMDEFIQEIRIGETQLSGTISLGSPGSFGLYLLKELISWQNKNPYLKLEIEYGPNSVMERSLQSGKMDIAITSEPLDSRYFINEEFFTQEFVLVSHPSLEPSLESWESFCSNPFIDYVGSDNIFQKWLGAHFKKYYLTPNQLNVRTKINNMESIFYLLQKKVGFTIFPSEPLFELIEKKKLKIHKTQKTITNSLYLVCRNGQILSKKVQALREVILSF